MFLDDATRLVYCFNRLLVRVVIFKVVKLKIYEVILVNIYFWYLCFLSGHIVLF